MDKKIRTFIAVKISPEPELLALFRSFKELLAGESINWVDEYNLHLTLKFLGDISQNQVEEIKSILKEICSGMNSFSFELYGCGFFKAGRKPRVLYAGIKHLAALEFFFFELENALFKLNFQKETRDFKPHLTLGRIKLIKGKVQFLEAVEKYKTLKIQRVNVSEIILYQSILKPEGPVYIPLETVKLKP